MLYVVNTKKAFKKIGFIKTAETRGEQLYRAAFSKEGLHNDKEQ